MKKLAKASIISNTILVLLNIINIRAIVEKCARLYLASFEIHHYIKTNSVKQG